MYRTRDTSCFLSLLLFRTVAATGMLLSFVVSVSYRTLALAEDVLRGSAGSDAAQVSQKELNSEQESDANERRLSQARPKTTLDLGEIFITAAPLTTAQGALPGSVSVLSRDAIEANGPDYFQQQIQTIPNFNFAGGTSRPRFFQIRGVGELEQYEGAPNASVGVVVDDVDLTGVGAATTLFDVSQVEILRGSQSVLFGSSALAGVVSIRSTDPTPEVDGTASLSAGSDHLFAGGAAAGGSLIKDDDALQMRVAAYHHYQDGFRHNEFIDRDSTNKRDEFTGRMKVRYRASDVATFDVGVLAVDLDNGYDAFAIDNSLTTQSDRPGKDTDTLNLLTLHGRFDLGNDLSLLSISSVYHTDSEYSFDGDWGNNPFWGINAPYDYFSSTTRNRTAYAQQLRLTSGPSSPRIGEDERWLVGGYLHHLDEDSDIRQFSNNDIYDSLFSNYEALTSAVFGEFDIPLFRQTTFSLGGRLENRATDYSDSRDNMFSPQDLMVGLNSSLLFELQKERVLYLTLARGFKGGGFNVSTGVPDGLREYRPEAMYTLETGTKSSWLDGKLTTDFGIFVAWRRDQQLKFATQTDPTDPLTFVYLTENAGEGRNEGIEGNVGYRVTEKLRWDLNGGLLRARITDVNNEAIAGLNGRDQAHAPRWQYASGFTYFINDNWWSEVGVTGRAGFYFDYSNDQRTSPYHLVNGAVGYSFGRWSIRVWGRNILDKRYAIRGFYFGNEPPDFPNKRYIQRGDPVLVGSTVSFAF